MKAGFVTALALALSACASADSMDGDAESAFEASDVERGRQALGFNEDTCPGTPADADLAADAVTSPDEQYDHATCPHQFIVTKKVSGTQGLSVSAIYAGGAGGQFPCSGSWVQLAVWKRRATVPSGSQWSKVVHTDLVQGVDAAPGAATPASGAACKASILVPLPDDPRPTEYQVVAQAGWTIAYQPVTVGFVASARR